MSKILVVASLVAFTLVAGGSQAVSGRVQSPARAAITQYNLEKGVALSGYDPTSYFPEGGGKPTKGDKELTATHRGVIYRFAGEANRDLFLADPDRFEPAYGGWCAYAMAMGDKVEIDPKSFLIEGGRLLVFYKGLLNNTREKWKQEGADKLAPRADAAWRKLSGEAPPRDAAQLNLEQGLALGGFDPVAYRMGAPAPGSESITAKFQGVTYRFLDESNRARFLIDPATYEARYGGWSARAMARGERGPVDPRVFLHDEQGPFLFASEQERDEFLASRKSLQSEADGHWARFLAER